MGLDSWIGICFAFLVIGGGVIARVKGDYFSRGMGISIITNIFGVIALILSPPSKARKDDEHDIQAWPPTSYWAIFAEMFLVLILLLKYWISKIL